VIVEILLPPLEIARRQSVRFRMIWRRLELAFAPAKNPVIPRVGWVSAAPLREIVDAKCGPSFGC
jgi:hypothetical protein